MTTRRRAFALVLAGSLALTGLTACSSSEDEKPVDISKAQGEITWMTQSLQKDFGDFFRERIAKFEKENPGTKINWVDESGGPEFDQKMMQQAVNGKMADVINVPSPTILALTKADQLLDLDKALPESGKRFIPDIWKSVGMGKDGAHTAFPWYFSPFVTTYNKQVFRAAGLDENTPPKTMDEMFEFSHKIAKTGEYNALWGNANWYLISQWHGMGVKIMNDEGTEFTFAKDPNALKWMNEMISLYKDGGIPKDSLTGELDPGKEYLNGRLAFGTPNPGFIRNIKKNNPEVYKQTGVGSYPINPGLKYEFSGQFIAVNAKTKNKALALKWADYITSAEEELAWTRDGGAVIFPGATEALDNLIKNPPEAVAKDPVFKQTYEVAAKEAKNSEAFKASFYVTGQVKNALVENVNKGIRGEVSAEQALENAQKEMNELLSALNN
ncbi:ABC transporter substrate-binding protein [Boudabousia liubingyangii]|uniref:ABC transporter substrate-binding protein n=1 Tax=Boudabousia liubingyangii TaxID=1921764 RepID=A0A1Q5PNS1_9ACTO|nr:extracellular solute-binding protein [Boudabousia liubingyangii]OKL49065.1 ABC transporter substrate-binding protein [Boudabousia liubingyangii]